MKFKVGDLVRVREDLTLKRYGSERVTKEMLELKGCICTITKVTKTYYYLQEDEGGFYWTDEMLEPVEVKNCDMDKKIKDTIKTWDDWKIDEYNNNFAISKYSEKLPYNSEKNCDTCKNYNTYFDCSQCNNGDEWEKAEEKEDLVNHPKHYNMYRVEVIDIIEDATKELKGMEAVNLGHIIRYVLRYQFKNGVQDLKKARFYLDKQIKLLEDKQ